MAYIVESKVRAFFHENGKQITKDGMHTVEVKFVEFLSKCCRQFNGHHRRIDAGLVAMMKF